MTEIPLPRIAGQGTVCVISTRGQARKARVEKFELDEGFPTVSSPLPKTASRMMAAMGELPVYIYIYIYIYVCVCVCICMHIYIYIYTHYIIL